MGRLRKSFMLGWILLIVSECLSATQAQAQEKDYIPQEDQSVAALIASLRTPALREAVKQQVAALRSAPTTQQNIDGILAALNFLYDLKADKVLLAFTHPYHGKEVMVNEQILINCLDICTASDLPELYQAADAFSGPRIMIKGVYYSAAMDGGIQLRWGSYVERLAERTSKTLGVKYVPIQDTSKEGVRQWWVMAYNTAKQQGTLKDISASTDKYFAELTTKSYPVSKIHRKLPGTY